MAAPKTARTENTVARCEAHGPRSRPQRSLNSDILCVLPKKEVGEISLFPEAFQYDSYSSVHPSPLYLTIRF